MRPQRADPARHGGTIRFDRAMRDLYGGMKPSGAMGLASNRPWAVMVRGPLVMATSLTAARGVGLGGAINLASRDGVPEVLLTEAVEDQTTENRPLVQKALDTFDLVRADALPRVASRALMLEAAEQWKTR
jgi:hypothetical protein